MQNNKMNFIFINVAVLFVGFFIGWFLQGEYFTKNKDVSPCCQNETPKTVMNMPQMDMSGAMDGMMSGLAGKKGDDFDKAFLSEMIVHHQGAVDMAKEVLTTSKRPELRALAKNIITAQTKEIDMMKAWQKKWFK